MKNYILSLGYFVSRRYKYTKLQALLIKTLFNVAVKPLAQRGAYYGR